MSAQLNQKVKIMCYISDISNYVISRILYKIIKDFQWCKTRKNQEEENHFRHNKHRMTLFGKSKIKFSITLISHSSKMRKIKILFMSIPFLWNKCPTNWANNGKSKLINCSNHTHLADKYSWTCYKFGFIITQ